MTKKYDKGDVLCYNSTFILMNRACYLEYVQDGSDYSVTDHNLSIHCIQKRNNKYQFNGSSGGMAAVHFVNGTLKPLDESNARVFLNEFIHIKNTTINTDTLATLEMFHKIFLKNQLFANQVTIHEED